MKTVGLALISVAYLLVTNSSLADVPHTFSSGTPAKASEMNENLSSLDARIQALESPAYSVDCSSDSKALADVVSDLPYGKTSFISVSGNCVVDDYLDFFHKSAFIYSDNGASIEGKGSDEVISAGTGSLLYLRDITIRTSTAVGIISATHGSHLRLRNVTIVGANLFEQEAVTVAYGSSAELRENVTISQVSYGVSGVYGSTIAVRGTGHTITTSGGDNWGIQASWGSVAALRAENSTINGIVHIGGNSTLRLDSGTTITNNVEVRDNSYARLRGTVVGNIDADSSSKVE